ncbi:anti-sigma factor family protein [Gandjariella thermophila]|uniref:anti-sigma factor family protein n=1 Tax=Gandjariella thermophila TaxID=1931992 RepID=UPI0010F7D5A2|nr:hypothetical protein [Gandjariella thermophila]
MTCEEFRELASELALGILPGRERAAALAHRDRCSTCREHLDALTTISDDLRTLVPDTEPPVGFETRLLDHLHARTRVQRRRRRLLATITAAALVIAAGLGGWSLGTLTQHQPPTAAPVSPSPRLLTATFTADHRDAGQAFAYTGTPPWIYMAVDTEHDTTTVSCQLQTTDGHLVTIGQFQLSNGYGYWGTPINLDPTTLATARLIATNGTIIATATFTT